MLDWLSKIWCAIVQLPELIADQLVGLVNLAISGIAGAAQAALDVLPDIPEAPDVPADWATALGWVNWLMPLGGLLSGVAIIATLLIIFWGVAIVLRWVKAA
jgi:hypothetical protein